MTTDHKPESDQEPEDEVQGVIGAMQSIFEDDEREIDPRRIIRTVRTDEGEDSPSE